MSTERGTETQTSQAKSGPERRRAPRAKATFPVRVRDTGGGPVQTHVEAGLKDLSSNGLCCHYPEALPEMNLVRLEIELPEGSGSRWHEVQGAVVRCEKLRDRKPATYEVAVYFTEIEGGTRRAIERFVATQVR